MLSSGSESRAALVSSQPVLDVWVRGLVFPLQYMAAKLLLAEPNTTLHLGAVGAVTSAQSRRRLSLSS